MIEPATFAMSIVADRLRAESHALFTIYLHRLGRHGSFLGRPYRRGKTRCAFCGAPLDATDLEGPMPTRLYSEESRDA